MSLGEAGQEPLAEVLFLRLEGPLMAWGDNARWTVRDTRREPTKSGVIGLLAACLGWAADRGDDGRIAELARSVQLAVRADRAGAVIRDYHTIVGGVLSAEGKIKETQKTKEPETVVSERYYLSDACFLVALLGPHDTLDLLERAVGEPVWPPYLGRKSCPPSAPLYPALAGHPSRGTFRSLQEALAQFPYLGRDEPPPAIRAVIEAPRAGARPPAPLQRRRDLPLSLSPRLFVQRDVYEVHVPLVATPQRRARNGDDREG